jgi:hypothetical protein
MTPIEVVQALLGKMGLKLSCIRRAQAADGRRGVYESISTKSQLTSGTVFLLSGSSVTN